MKLITSTTILALATWTGSCRAASLRNSNNITLQQRHLQVGDANEDYDIELYQEGSDADLINKIIKRMLPTINRLFQNNVPDPFDIPLDGVYNLGDIQVGPCSAAANLEYDFGNLVGLSTLSIDSLQLILGTEKVGAGCFGTEWKAGFDITVSNAVSLAMHDLLGGVSASACGAEIGRSISGGIDTYMPMMRGAIEISGQLFTDKATVNLADIGTALEVNYDRMEAFVDNMPDEFNMYLGRATAELSRLMQQELSGSVEEVVHQISEESIEKGETPISFREFLALNTGFLRNDAKRRATSLYDNTVGAWFSGLRGTSDEESSP